MRKWGVDAGGAVRVPVNAPTGAVIGSCPACNSELLSPVQAAERLGVSRQRVHELIQRGRLQAVSIGSGKRWVIAAGSLKTAYPAPKRTK